MSMMQMQPSPPALSHFLIFNPTLKPDPQAQQDTPTSPTGDPGEDSERAQQRKDDANDAAQILFYTSRSSRTVSRETMLKQVRLIKGLMGFTDMVIPAAQSGDLRLGTKDRDESIPSLSIRTAKSRMIVYSPEKDFYIYTNITLSTTTGDDGKIESAHNAQGLSDQTIIRAISQGYEDFKLLHGTMSDLLPPSPPLTSTLEKYWTRFAFDFENDIISSPPSLFSSIPSLLSAPMQVQQGAARALEVFIEDVDLPSGTDFGLISHTGPLHTTSSDPALQRYLVGLVSADLPLPEVVKPDARATLGLGRRDQKESRMPSWSIGNLGTWVPSIPGVTSRNVSPTPASPLKVSEAKVERAVATIGPGVKEKSRWGLGLPSLGLGEAMGTVGGVFGLGGGLGGGPKAGPVTAITKSTVAVKSDKSVPSRPSSIASSSRVAPSSSHSSTNQDNLPGEGSTNIETSREAEEAIEARLGSVALEDTASIISPTVVDVGDLQDAVDPSVEIDLGWNKRAVHVETCQVLEKRRLAWVIRDNLLLYILYSPSNQSSYPSPPSSPVLALYSKLNSIISPERGSFESSRTANSQSNTTSIVVTSGHSIEKIGEFDTSTVASLANIRDMLGDSSSINEIYAKTPHGRFIISKRLDESRDGVLIAPRTQEEVHMVISRKDVNLSDAEHAMRAFLRARQG